MSFVAITKRVVGRQMGSYWPVSLNHVLKTQAPVKKSTQLNQIGQANFS